MPTVCQIFQSLADASPISGDPSSYQSVGWLLLSLAALAGAGNQIMGLISKFRDLRTQAPGEVSADRIKALEEKVSAVELRMERHMGSIETRIESLTKTLTMIVSDFNYAVGRIDGRGEKDI